jgi:hypothetical protein
MGTSPLKFPGRSLLRSRFPGSGQVRNRRRQRRYLALPPLAGAASLAFAALLAQPLAQAASPFGSDPVEADRVIALAQPAGGDRWNLLVVEQREPAPPCWRRHADGTVTTFERNLPESTCTTYLSSGATSLRIGGEDLRHPWRLRVERRHGQLQLLAVGSQQPQPLLVGSSSVPLAPGNGRAAVELQLQEGWSVERRTYEGQTLRHLYMANANPLPLLLAQARSGGGLLAMPLPPPPPNPDGPQLSSSSSRLARLESLRFGRRPSGNLRPSGEGDDSGSSGVIALQVVPYRP